MDEALLTEAMTATGLKTHQAVIEEALRLLIRFKRQEQTRALRGQLHWEGASDAIWPSTPGGYG